MTIDAKTKKRIAGAVAVISIAALVLAGTFAWIDFSQHKTNPFRGAPKPFITLNNKFTPPYIWTTDTPPVENKITVTNLAKSNHHVMVRVRFKEYLQAFTLDLEKKLKENDVEMLFATHAEGYNQGEYLRFYTQEEAIEWLATNTNQLAYTPININHDGLENTPDLWFLRTTNTEEKNGLYGKPMVDPAGRLNPTPVANMLFGGKERMPLTQTIHKNDDGENSYLVHRWDGTPITNYAPWNGTSGNPDEKAIDHFIQWNLGPNTVPLADWAASGGKTTNKWVMADDGWCYWVTGLPPGSTTISVLDSVRLLRPVGESFAYDIHVDMEAITYEEFSKQWPEMPSEITAILQDIIDMTDLRLELENLLKIRYDEVNYTPESWADYQRVLTARQSDVNDMSLNNDDLRYAIESLKQARLALVSMEHMKNILYATILDFLAKKEAHYSAETYAPAKALYNIGVALVSTPGSSNLEMSSINTQLRAAMCALEPRPGWAELQETVNEMSSLGLYYGDYTTKTWARYSTAFTKARNITSNSIVTPSDELLALKNELVAAKNGLVRGMRTMGADWRIVKEEEGKVLIVTEDTVASFPFHSAATYPTWGSSDIRNKLQQQSFLWTIFNNRQLARLVPTEVTTPASASDPTTPTVSTDRVFLLSEDELIEYFPNEADRIVCAKGTTTPTPYLLRNEKLPARVAFVTTDGVIGDADVNHQFTGIQNVRLAAWIELE